VHIFHNLNNNFRKMSSQTFKQAKNGYGDPVTFCNIPVYFGSYHSSLGCKYNKNVWIEDNVTLMCYDVAMVRESVSNLLINWQLYEDGWLYTPDYNTSAFCKHLFNYLCQIGTCTRPQELQWMIDYQR